MTTESTPGYPAFSEFSDVSGELRDTYEAMRAEVERLKEANEQFGQRQEWWNRKMFELEAQLKLNTDAYWDEVDRLTEKASLARDRAEKAETEIARLQADRGLTQPTHLDGCWKYGSEHYECARAEIERLRASCDDYASHKQRQDERIIELQAEVERLRADAERYRWLRDNCQEVDVRAGLGWIAFNAGGLDAGIDAAIDAAREES